MGKDATERDQIQEGLNDLEIMRRHEFDDHETTMGEIMRLEHLKTEDATMRFLNEVSRCGDCQMYNDPLSRKYCYLLSSPSFGSRGVKGECSKSEIRLKEEYDPSSGARIITFMDLETKEILNQGTILQNG